MYHRISEIANSMYLKICTSVMFIFFLLQEYYGKKISPRRPQKLLKMEKIAKIKRLSIEQ